MNNDLPQNEQWVEEVRHEGKLLALIVRAGFARPGIHFFTEPDFSQQLAYIQHPRGKLIEPHYHVPKSLRIEMTQEVLLIRRGKLRVDFFRHDEHYLESRVLGPGDFILLAEGAHGFEVLEDIEMIEVKQGPYIGEAEKVRLVNAKANPPPTAT